VEPTFDVRRILFGAFTRHLEFIRVELLLVNTSTRGRQSCHKRVPLEFFVFFAYGVVIFQ
jgi:hypothetical protein